MLNFVISVICIVYKCYIFWKHFYRFSEELYIIFYRFSEEIEAVYKQFPAEPFKFLQPRWVTFHFI